MLRDVTPEDIEALVAFMKMRAIKSQRVQKLLALLRAACNVAKLNPNLWTDLKSPNPTRTRRRKCRPTRMMMSP
jgi:hypothetical protein